MAQPQRGVLETVPEHVRQHAPLEEKRQPRRPRPPSVVARTLAHNLHAPLSSLCSVSHESRVCRACMEALITLWHEQPWMCLLSSNLFMRFVLTTLIWFWCFWIFWCSVLYFHGLFGCFGVFLSFEGFFVCLVLRSWATMSSLSEKKAISGVRSGFDDVKHHRP